MNQSIRSTGPPSLVGLLAVLLMIGLFAGPALAQHGTAGPAVAPTVQDFPGGPPNCPDGTGFRFGGDPEDDAPLSDGASAGRVTITLNPDKTVVGFETDGSVLVAHVFVKGGAANTQNWYNYTSFAGGGVAHDDGLTTPGTQEISHVDVCVVSAPPTDPPPTDAPPTDAPPTEAPPTDAPPTEAPTPPDTGTAAIDPTSGSGSRDAAFIMLLVATMAGAGLLIRALSRREPRSL